MSRRSTRRSLARWGEPVVVPLLVGLGVVLMACVVFVLVVIGFGHVPRGAERSTAVLALLASIVVALVTVPTSRWLVRVAHRLVGRSPAQRGSSRSRSAPG